jgi:hypothetical protein
MKSEWLKKLESLEKVGIKFKVSERTVVYNALKLCFLAGRIEGLKKALTKQEVKKV